MFGPARDFPNGYCRVADNPPGSPGSVRWCLKLIFRANNANASQSPTERHSCMRTKGIDPSEMRGQCIGHSVASIPLMRCHGCGKTPKSQNNVWNVRMLGLGEHGVLRKSEFSIEADSENYLGTSPKKICTSLSQRSHATNQKSHLTNDVRNATAASQTCRPLPR